MGGDHERLLAFARRLQTADTFADLARFVCAEVRSALGYSTAWLYLVDEDRRTLRFVAVQGDLDGTIGPELEIPIDSDPYITSVLASDRPMVVEDAQSDPNVNRAIVEELGNRTIVNLPMHLVDSPVGILGAGTFGDEGVRMPTDEGLAYLQAAAQHVVVASARIALGEARERRIKEREEMERRLARHQHLESIGSLAGGIAHDFNNLLTVMFAGISMLRINATEAQMSDLSVIEDAAAQGAELTKRLLAMSRRQPIELKLLDVNERLRALVEMLRRVIPTTISVDLLEGHHLGSVLGDSGQLDQVFMNLALNAVDAMPQGGRLTIESEMVVVNGEYVRAHPWAKKGRYALVSVTDTGAGMDQETLQQIFEPFFTTKGEDGTGLGLAVSYGAVKQHQGMLHAYSEAGIGTTIKVYLPTAERSAADVGTHLDAPVTGGAELILLADDTAEIRTGVARVLESNGYRVHTVSNGAEALAAVNERDFDLVILDAVMPVMAGRETHDAIRALKPDLPVLFASGYGPEELDTRFLQGVQVTVLSKPFDPDTLLRAVRFSLDG